MYLVIASQAVVLSADWRNVLTSDRGLDGFRLGSSGRDGAHGLLDVRGHLVTTTHHVLVRHDRLSRNRNSGQCGLSNRLRRGNRVGNLAWCRNLDESGSILVVWLPLLTGELASFLGGLRIVDPLLLRLRGPRFEGVVGTRQHPRTVNFAALPNDERLNLAGRVDDDLARLGNPQQQRHGQPLLGLFHLDDDGRWVELLLAPRQQTVAMVDDLTGGGILDDNLTAGHGVHLAVDPEEQAQARHLRQPDDRQRLHERLGIIGLSHLPPDGRHQSGMARRSRLHDDEAARPGQHHPGTRGVGGTPSTESLGH